MSLFLPRCPPEPRSVSEFLYFGEAAVGTAVALLCVTDLWGVCGSSTGLFALLRFVFLLLLYVFLQYLSDMLTAFYFKHRRNKDKAKPISYIQIE